MENCGLGPCDQSSLGLVNSVENCGVEPCDQSKAGLLNSMEICGTAIVNPALYCLSHMILDLFSIASFRVFLIFFYILLVNFKYVIQCLAQFVGDYKLTQSVKN